MDYHRKYTKHTAQKQQKTTVTMFKDRIQTVFAIFYLRAFISFDVEIILFILIERYKKAQIVHRETGKVVKQ